jgi:hypothetical protein
MGKVNIKNGTPGGNEHLCLQCNWGQCMTGYRESDRLVICNKTSPDMIVPFAMLECTGFIDKHRPDWEQMTKLAIDIHPTHVSAKTAGFSTATEPDPVVVPDEDEQDEDEEDEAAFVRSMIVTEMKKDPAAGAGRGYIW